MSKTSTRDYQKIAGFIYDVVKLNKNSKEAILELIKNELIIANQDGKLEQEAKRINWSHA